jgi:hypothetical protein
MVYRPDDKQVYPEISRKPHDVPHGMPSDDMGVNFQLLFVSYFLDAPKNAVNTTGTSTCLVANVFNEVWHIGDSLDANNVKLGLTLFRDCKRQRQCASGTHRAVIGKQDFAEHRHRL